MYAQQSHPSVGSQAGTFETMSRQSFVHRPQNQPAHVDTMGLFGAPRQGSSVGSSEWPVRQIPRQARPKNENKGQLKKGYSFRR